MISMDKCKICANEINNKHFTAREMMFGFKDEFEYLECSQCGCLQIIKIPDNILKYYPDNYLSFQGQHLKKDFLRTYLRKERAKFCITGKSLMGNVMTKLFGLPDYYYWFKGTNIKFNSEILDVGCGVGYHLLYLQEMGFTNLSGVDPYIKENIDYKNGVKVIKDEVYNLNQRYDFIIMHHSFEHISEPLKMLKKLYSLLKPNSYLVIKIPVAGCYAWKKYGVNWVQLDAPRHFFLHTEKSMEILAEQAGFQVNDVLYESTDLQFWGSEQYLKNIPLRAKNSYNENPKQSIFSKKQINDYINQAKELNQNKSGDTACFYLYKK